MRFLAICAPPYPVIVRPDGKSAGPAPNCLGHVIVEAPNAGEAATRLILDLDWRNSIHNGWTCPACSAALARNAENLIQLPEAP